MSQNPGKPSQPKPAAASDNRRGFLSKLVAIVAGAVTLLVPAGAGLAVFLDPLRRRNRASKLIPVTTVDSLPPDGAPLQFPIIDERVDAWNRSSEPVGAVYLRRDPQHDRIECLTAVCPHAGCFVDFDADTNTYKCPCHNSEFTVDGQIIEPSPSPRAMDTLECKVQDQAILVRYQTFYSGRTEKVPRS
jgi:menaquinol-cytochrome c reductase iron-sulfur subunit